MRWTLKSLRRLAGALRTQGDRVSPQTVAELPGAMDYSLQANRKTKEGAAHPDLGAQFEYINAQPTAAGATAPMKQYAIVDLHCQQ